MILPLCQLLLCDDSIYLALQSDCYSFLCNYHALSMLVRRLVYGEVSNLLMSTPSTRMVLGCHISSFWLNWLCYMVFHFYTDSVAIASFGDVLAQDGLLFLATCFVEINSHTADGFIYFGIMGFCLIQLDIRIYELRHECFTIVHPSFLQSSVLLPRRNMIVVTYLSIVNPT